MIWFFCWPIFDLNDYLRQARSTSGIITDLLTCFVVTTGSYASYNGAFLYIMRRLRRMALASLAILMPFKSSFVI